MDVIFKITGIGLVVIVAEVIFEKSGKKDMALVINLIGLLIGLGILLPILKKFLESLRALVIF